MVKQSAFGFMLGLMVACGQRETMADPASPPSVQSLNGPRSFRAMVFSQAFGQRFSLPTGGVQPLDAGLQAVVLRVVQRSGDHPDCYLDLYVDDSLDLAFPEGSEGMLGRPDDENPFFFVHDMTPLGAEEHRWDRMLGSFHAVACRKSRDNCRVSEQAGPYAYARHLVPGIALQTYSLSCNAFEPKNGPTEMWLLRAGRDAKELYPLSTDASATYRFAMPIALFEHAAPRVRQAIKYYEDNPVGPEPARGEFSVPGRRE